MHPGLETQRGYGRAGEGTEQEDGLPHSSPIAALMFIAWKTTRALSFGHRETLLLACVLGWFVYALGLFGHGRLMIIA